MFGFRTSVVSKFDLKCCLRCSLPWYLIYHSITIQFRALPRYFRLQRQSRCLFARILAEQPEPMGKVLTGASTLESIGTNWKGGAFWAIISLLLNLSAHSKR